MSLDPQIMSDISQVMATAVVETFNGMFGQELVSARVREQGETSAAGQTCACLVLEHGDAPAKFFFSFDDRMLALTARAFFSDARVSDPVVRQDIACAVANIVGTRVKNYLNAQPGNKFEMTLPFAVKPEEVEWPARDAVYLNFSYNDDNGRINDGGVIVNFTMREPRAAHC
jgi:hypothetical protein